MTEKRPGPAPGVRLIEVSVKRELTVNQTFVTCSNFNTLIKSIFTILMLSSIICKRIHQLFICKFPSSVTFVLKEGEV